MDQHYAQGGGLQSAPTDDGDIVSLADVVDVDRDGGISADAMLLHQGDELTLCQVVGW